MKRFLKPTTVLIVMLLLVALALVIPIAFKGTRPALTAAGGLLAAVAALGYALLTFSLVDATERLTQASADALEAQTRPNVILAAEPFQTVLYLVIENAGASEAFDVRVNVSAGRFDDFPNQMLTGARFLEDGFTYLAPHQRHHFLLANLARALPARQASVEFTVTYRSRAGKPYGAAFPFNLQELLGVGLIESHTPLGRIADSAEKIQRHLTGLP